MSDRELLWRFRPIDWKWVGIGYCFFISFHMLPSYFIFDIDAVPLAGGAGWIGPAWFYFGLAFIAYYIGLKSHGVTVTEPGISALLYTLTLVVFLGKFTGQSLSVRTAGTVYLTAVSIIVVAIFSAWVGEKVQMRKDGQGGKNK